MLFYFQVTLSLSVSWCTAWTFQRRTQAGAREDRELSQIVVKTKGVKNIIKRIYQQGGGGNGNPLQYPVFLLGEFHGQRSQVGYSPWGHKELDTTERLSTHACTPTHRHTHTKFFPLTFKKSLLKYILRTYCIPKIGITCTFFSLKVSLKKSQPNLCAWCRSICCRTHYK